MTTTSVIARSLGAWPAPALAAWASCWVAFGSLRAANVAPSIAFTAVAVVGAALGMFGSTPWRRVFIGAGFPVSMLSTGAAASWPSWAWLAPLVALAMLYPVHAWRDAPLFPTPEGALDAIGRCVSLPAGARVLDAGCGLGAGLLALRRAFPDASLFGIEWSRPLATACAWRLRRSRVGAAVTRSDMWTADWSSYAMVYVFQRPESMSRAAVKASRELAPGAWLASLEFEASELVAEHVVEIDGGRQVWLYRAPFRQVVIDPATTT